MLGIFPGLLLSFTIKADIPRISLFYVLLSGSRRLAAALAGDSAASRAQKVLYLRESGWQLPGMQCYDVSVALPLSAGWVPTHTTSFACLGSTWGVATINAHQASVY